MKKIIKNLISAAILTSACTGAASETALVNLVTKEEGIHRVTYEQLKASGADLNGFPTEEIAITYQGKNVSRFISDSAKDGFTAGDSIEFLAQDVYNRYTTEAVYTLEINPNFVKQALIFNPARQRDNATSIGVAKNVLAEQKFFSINASNLNDPFVMEALYGSSVVSKDFTLDLPALSFEGGDTLLEVTVYGGADTGAEIDHSVEIILNGTLVAKEQFSGKEIKTIRTEVPTNLLKEIGNNIEIVLPLDVNVPYDYIMVDSINATYPRELAADGESFKFESADALLNINKLEAGDAVYESVEGELIRTEAFGNSVIVESAFSGDSMFYVVSDELPSPVFQTILNEEDITTGEAEYLVIAHPNFIDENLQQLVNLRQGNYSTKVVDVNQVYAQFGRDTAEAEPIQDYIQFAAEKLNTKMVLLVGGDSHDYHGYLGDSVSHIPTLYKEIGGLNTKVTHAPTDAAYGDLDEDGIPDIAIGRLPVRTNIELENVVTKIIAFEQRDYKGTSVFAADNIDNGKSYSFTEEAEEVIASLPTKIGENVQTAFAEVDGVKGAGEKVINAVNEGVELTAYLGHSSMFNWGNEGILNTQDIAGFTNDLKPTVVAQYGCWNTLFTLPNGNTMAHVALLDGKNGAATVMGASTLTLAKSEVALGKALFETMYVPGKTLGEALVEAKQSISEKTSVSDVLLGWQIIGDPAIVMNPAF